MQFKRQPCIGHIYNKRMLHSSLYHWHTSRRSLLHPMALFLEHFLYLAEVTEGKLRMAPCSHCWQWYHHLGVLLRQELIHIGWRRGDRQFHCTFGAFTSRHVILSVRRVLAYGLRVLCPVCVGWRMKKNHEANVQSVYAWSLILIWQSGFSFVRLTRGDCPTIRQ